MKQQMYHIPFVLLHSLDIPFSEVEQVRHIKKNNFKGERKKVQEW